MSCTIYGNTTKNEIDIDDMVDDNTDIIYPIDDENDYECYEYFARLVMSRKDVKDEPLPAIAIFAKDDPFEAIYAEILPGTFEQYYNNKKEFNEQLKSTIESFKQFMIKCLK